MAKLIPNCSSSSCPGLSPSNLRPFVPGWSPEYSPHSSFRNLPRILIGLRRPSHHPRFIRSFASSEPAIEYEDSLAATVYVKGLPLSTGEGELKKAFSEFGEVTRVKIFLDKETMQPLGSAFVWFASKELAELATKEMDGEFFKGRFISTAMAKQREQIKRQRSTAPFKF